MWSLTNPTPLYPIISLYPYYIPYYIPIKSHTIISFSWNIGICYSINTKKGYVKIWIQKKLQKKHTQGGRREDCRFCGVGVEICKGHVKIETQNKFTKQNTQRLEGGETVDFMELVLKYRRDVSKYKYKKNYNQNHTEGGRRGDCRFCGGGVETSKGCANV